MQLAFIPLDRLAVSKTNMRWAKRPPEVSDILPTVRRRGVLQPIIVRAGNAPEHYEIVAGSRRFHAASLVAAERTAAGETPEAMPCAILDDSDDASAVEASLIENVARLEADEVTRWETFTRLIREGRSPSEIGETFGLPDLAVRQVLALGNLLPRIRALYAAEQIDRLTIRYLTLASKSRQRAWLALADDPDGWAPTGHRLKAWLLGGHAIAATHALFDVEASGLATVADLFGEDRYFADAEAFWEAQNAAIEARRSAFIAAGWADAVVIGPAGHFASWDHAKAGKRSGGRVYIEVRASGEVAFHEGYVTRKEAARLERGEEPVTAKPPRPEVTGPMQTYIDLHRHAAVRAELAARPEIALRLMAAHAIVGSPLWAVRPEPQTARSEAIAESVEGSPGETHFDRHRRAVLALLGFDADEPTVTGGNGDAYGLTGLFQRLLALDDGAVMQVIAVVMGETLASGGAPVEALGLCLGTDMARWWEADEAFFALLRDKEVAARIVAEVAGEEVAAANAGSKVAALKAIVGDCLAGRNGRAKRSGWVPRWMAFPPAAYTARGGVGTVRAHALAAAAAESVSDEAAAEAETDAATEAATEANGGAAARADARPVEAVEVEVEVEAEPEPEPGPEPGAGAGAGDDKNCEDEGGGNPLPDASPANTATGDRLAA